MPFSPTRISVDFAVVEVFGWANHCSSLPSTRFSKPSCFAILFRDLQAAGRIEHDEFFKMIVPALGEFGALLLGILRLALGALPASAHSLAGQLAIADGDDAPDMLRDQRIVADDADGQPQVAVEPLEEVVNLIGGRGVELAGRFISQQQFWLVGQGDGDGDALLFAAGELNRFVS